MATYHPSFVLRAPGEEARHAARAAMVEAVRTALALPTSAPPGPSG